VRRRANDCQTTTATAAATPMGGENHTDEGIRYLFEASGAAM